MTIRCARHSQEIEEVESFFTQVIVLQKLGSFQNHESYEGQFLGFSNQGWHLAFNFTEENINHTPDADNLLELYMSQQLMNKVQQQAKKQGVNNFTPKNLYWQDKGLDFLDPVEYAVIITIQNT